MKKLLVGLLAAATLATGAAAAFEKVNTYNGNFTDVKDTSWYAENVKSAYELGFVNGNSETTYNPDGNVTVAEGITMAARLHARYNGTEVTKKEKVINEHRFEFDSADGMRFNHAYGDVADGVLKLVPDAPNHNGNYDPGLFLEGLDLTARDYDKMVFRMRRDVLPNVDPDAKRHEVVEIFFITSNDIAFSADRQLSANLNSYELTEWVEFSVNLADHELWRDQIKSIRFDPTNNNGEYYIDYIALMKNEEVDNSKWYDMYVDYAIDNKIMEKGRFRDDELSRNITRAEIAYLFAAAVPESYFNVINPEIEAVPDINKHDMYADTLLMLYRAGIVLGSDKYGNFNPDSDIKRSEIAAIINRIALPESRVTGTIDATWDNADYRYDMEFNDPNYLSGDNIVGHLNDYDYENYPEVILAANETYEIVDGCIVLKPIMKEAGRPPYDPKIGFMGIDVNADQYTKMRVRMKLDIEGTPENMNGEFFFMPDGVTVMNEENALNLNFDDNYYVDASGWRVYEFFLGDHDNWKGTIRGFRFDPTNNPGTFTIDYIRFIRDENLIAVSDEELAANYTAREFFPDKNYENGVYVKEPAGDRQIVGKWTYGNEDAEPLWVLAPWWTNTCLINDRDTTTDEYTLTDTAGTKIIKYNPETKSTTFRLNADKVYNGDTHESGEMWPHILYEYHPYKSDYSKVPEELKPQLDLKADKIYAEIDIKMNDWVDTPVKEGVTNSEFLVYFYFAHKDIPGLHTYFGLVLFDSNGSRQTRYGYHKDSQSIQMIYGVPASELYGGAENSIYQKDGNFQTGEWKTVRCDVTSHVYNMIDILNKENWLGKKVSIEDFWVSGVNVGFEIWGNYQSEVEFKNLQLVAYDKNEQA